MIPLLAISLIVTLGALGQWENRGTPALPRAGKHHTLELVFTAATTPTNPFDTYLLKVELTDPAGAKFNVAGFYDGNGRGGPTGKVWKARLCPYRTRPWRWKTMSADAPDAGLIGLSGQFACIESDDPGGLVAQGRYFKLQDGDYFFPVAKPGWTWRAGNSTTAISSR